MLKVSGVNLRDGSRWKTRTLLKRFKKSHYFILAGVLAFTAIQPSYLMAIFNALNPPKVAPIYSEKVLSGQPEKLGSFTPIPADDPTEAARIAEQKYPEGKPINVERVGELTDKRTKYTSTYLNEDGTKTLEYSTIQQNYKENGDWKKINNKLTSYDYAGKDAFRGKAGRIDTDLRSLHNGISVDSDGREFSIKPVGVNNVKPEKVNENTVIYRDAWPNVDVKYELRGEMVKEFIILKNKSAQTTFDFNVTGGKVAVNPNEEGGLIVEGLSGYSFSPLSLDINEKGIMSFPPLSQAPTTNGLKVVLDEKWFNEQPDSSFPMTIDPTWNSNEPATSYKMYKSDGYYCGPSTCYANTGTLNDGSGWKSWRTYINFSYSALNNMYVLSTSVHGTYQSGQGGTTASKHIRMGESSCSNGFSCFGTQVGEDTDVTTDFYLGFKNALQGRIDADDYNTWWSFRSGGESTTKTYKPYYKINVTVTYDHPATKATLLSPANKSVITHTQPNLQASATDEDGDTVQYRYYVATGSDAKSGMVVKSAWTKSKQWTVPEHILQDGTTYYWNVETKGNSANPRTKFADNAKSFTIDLRTGKDSTQAYDTVGPVDVDLATGNLTTSVQSHSISALGGDIGLNLDYNSPALSRPGLIAEYWNNNTFTGEPIVTRNDPAIDFDWDSGTPDPAFTNDLFAGRWTGYITPQASGSYAFGCDVNDTCKVWVDDVLQVNQTSIGESFGSAVSLEAGVPVKFKAEMTENGGLGRITVKTNDGTTTQPIPESWFNTGAQIVTDQYGLTGRYYNNPAGDYAFPTALGDPERLMMVRRDSKINFAWGSGSPSPGLPSDKFLVKWKGYLTVPESGTYKLGATADDRVKIKLGTGFMGADVVVLDSWSGSSGEVWDTDGEYLTGGVKIPITVEYAEQTGNATFELMIDPGSTPQEMPITWLTPEANVLPRGWSLSVGLGSIRFERLEVQQKAAILSDSSGQAYEFTYNSSDETYTPPAGEESVLTANHDGSYTLNDVDGSTYLFDAEGKLTSYVGPQDDRQPAALKYEYSENPIHLKKIIDGVDNNRYGELFYAGDSECVTGAGMHAAPEGMLCAFITTDGDETYFQYFNDNLVRVETPGDAYEDFGYDEPYGRLISYRDVLANDAVEASVRDNDDETKTQIGYDELGRVTSVLAPAPTASADRMEHTYDYTTNGMMPLYRMTSLANGKHKASTSSTDSDFYLEKQQGYVYAEPQTGTRPIYNCITGSDPFESTSSTCEGYPVLGVLGHIYISQPDDVPTTALYRCNGGGDHTVSIEVGCEGKTTEYTLGYVITMDGYRSSTEMHATGASEPEGFMQRVEYDGKFRATKVTDNAGLVTETKWHNDKDMVLSTIDSLGLMSTTIYDEDDLPTDDYGPAPKAWFDTDRTPLSQYEDDIPRSETKYDEGIQGLATQYFSVTERYPSILPSGKELHRGDYLKSTDQRFKFVYQGDGNIVLYGPGGAVLWHANKTGVSSTRLVMQGDGNLVLYDGGTAKWSSGTGGGGSPRLIISNDGHAQIVNSSDNITWSKGGGYSVNAPGKTSLLGAPLFNETGVGSDPNEISETWATSPLPSSSDFWGVRMTGKMYLPTTGNWTFKINSDNGARLVVDDKTIISEWEDGKTRNHDTGTFNNSVANKPYRVMVEYYHLPGTPDNTSAPTFTLYMTPPGGSETDQVAQYFKPNYQLVTSEKAYDSVLSDTETQTEYSNPAYGLISKSTIDPSGLDLENDASYETPGAGYLRQTSRTMPGGTNYTYAYYGDTEAVDDPCTAGDNPVSQAGRLKKITEPDPDDTGTQTSRSTETIYNSSGDIVASRTNDDSWTCFTYDERGRQTQSVIPTINGRAGRTVQTVHVVSGNPLVEQTIDSVAGTTKVTYDLLGRVISAEDVWGNSYSMTFDDYGNVTEKVTPLGTEEFTYNTLYQLTDYELDSTVLATITYDTYGRVDTIVYPQAHDGVGDPLELTQVKRDNLERVTGASYVTSDGETLDETVVLSQLGKVIGATQTYDTQTLEADYTYDSVGRLTSATVGETQYDYGYGAPDSTTCSSNSDNNMSAHLNSNRTSYTVTNTTTTAVVTDDKLCYNYADQLTYSSDVNIGEPTYDDHGNTTSFEGNGTAMTFEYDADDYNIAIGQGTKRTEYLRNAEGGILRKKEFDDSTLTASYRYVAGGSILQTCNLSDDDDCMTIDKYISMPGNVTLTLSPSNPDADKQTVYSLHNDHGDTVLTLTGEGKTAAGLGTLLGYGPFGEMLLAGTLGTTTEDPLNAIDSTMGWASDPTRKQDGRYTTTFVQMGERVYIPSLGRFLQVDPVEGGTLNAYVYSHDPVNVDDYSGRFLPILVAVVHVAVRVVPVVVRVVQAIDKAAKLARAAAAAQRAAQAAARAAEAARKAAAAARAYAQRLAQQTMQRAAQNAKFATKASKAKPASVVKKVASKKPSAARSQEPKGKIAKKIYNSDKFGGASEKFGNSQMGAPKPGTLNQPGGGFKVGWSHKLNGDTVFRIGLGSKEFTAASGRTFIKSRFHINLLW